MISPAILSGLAPDKGLQFGVVLQQVAADRTFAITFSRTSLGRCGTREGRVLSRLSPGTPSPRYRSCQRQTVGFDMPVRRHQHDAHAPRKLARRVAVAQQSLKLSAVVGAKLKADVAASHPPIMPR